MRVLIIKTSSMGDVIHTLPALTDAGKALGGSIIFDWVVEENFAEIPSWHPLVDQVIPIAFRRWRKNIFSKKTREEWQLFRKKINANRYDLIIDAQGLLKSAFLSLFAKGIRCGANLRSARDPFASLFYQKKYFVVWQQHAIGRVRSLLSSALNYALPTSVPDYGIDRTKFFENHDRENYVVFLHGTTWDTKHWPEAYWIELAKRVSKSGFKIKLPWGNTHEKERAERIANSCDAAEVLPRLDLAKIAKVLAGAKAIVAVDTGLGHLAAALDVPTISLYGPTDPKLNGALGKSQIHLSADFSCSPCFNRVCSYRDPDVTNQIKPACFTTVSPERVFENLKNIFV